MFQRFAKGQSLAAHLSQSLIVVLYFESGQWAGHINHPWQRCFSDCVESDQVEADQLARPYILFIELSGLDVLKLSSDLQAANLILRFFKKSEEDGWGDVFVAEFQACAPFLYKIGESFVQSKQTVAVFGCEVKYDVYCIPGQVW